MKLNSEFTYPIKHTIAYGITKSRRKRATFNEYRDGSFLPQNSRFRQLSVCKVLSPAILERKHVFTDGMPKLLAVSDGSQIAILGDREISKEIC